MVRILTIAVAAACMWGCRAPQGRLMDPNEEDLVGARAAGTETHSRLIDEALTKLFNRHKSEVTSPLMKVAFVDLENKSAEELGDFREQLMQTIETLAEKSDRYRIISRRYVETALKEVRIQPDQVMIPKYMRQFTQILEQQNNPVDFLMYGVLTSGTTTGVESTQRDYMLTMEIINVRTGDTDKESARVRKEYKK